jgi:chlorite dismutase
MSRVTFIGGASGHWAIESVSAITGEGLASATRLDRVEASEFSVISGATWALRGVKLKLARVQPPLDRPDSTCATLIPIKKNAEWWALAQDERRRSFEEQSHHIAIGLEYLPAVARRLYHSKDLGEPFDFLTWFEYAPSDSAAFDELLRRLRATPEWSYVEREVEIRLTRVD